ncbi:DUF2963 domain-containing protein [Candidatus Phytoplasma solani]|uniref:DUF2963 domain-containing protein n=1 Tax=Candidatus Phytoplasma solani TaxID=69896 RepID=A0A421NXI4_9MOLU|nr:DUF2963 domain-containing protein [Candidatus Phytoplasma solani]RMI88712.1 hypothetical protein PSSA1_v1c3080 [Candidatus Phytoplasma solani]
MKNEIKLVKRNGWPIIEEYNQETNKLVKETAFNNDNKAIWFIREYEQYKNTGKEIKEINYGCGGGKNVRDISEYDKNTSELTKQTFLQSDGTIDCMYEFKQTARKLAIKETYFHNNGQIKEVKHINKTC